MNYNFLKPKPKEVDYSFLSKKVPKEQGEVKKATLPSHLGGGSYLVGKPGELIKEDRGYAGLPTRSGSERDHIMSVALGGTSDIDNLEYKPTTKDGRQQGKVTVELKSINDYLSGKISLNEARLAVATKQQQIKGLTPTEKEQTWQGQIGNVIKDAAKNFTSNLLKPFSKEAREEAKKRGTLSEWEYNKRAEIASRALDKDIKPDEYDEVIKTITPEKKQLIQAVGYEDSIERASKVITAPIRFTAGTLATAVVSYALEKADENKEYTPKTDAEKLIIGDANIKRLLSQEDIYGTIARGAGVPVALMAIAVIENPFLAGTGLSGALKTVIKKQASKNISKVGVRTIINIADDVIKTELKAGKIEKEIAEKVLKDINNLRIKMNLDTPKITPLENVAKQTTKQSDIGKPALISDKLKSGKTVISGDTKYIPEEKAVDLRRKITTERLISDPSIPNRIKNETIEKGLKADFRGIDEYDKVSFKQQAKLVGDIIDENPEKAIKIALGKEAPTNGALPESVFIAVKNQAIKNGDTDLLVRLATEEGGVAKESTILGQRIKMLDEGLTIDPFRNINEVVKTRRKVFKRKSKVSITEAKAKEIKNIQANIKPPKVDAWTAFIKEIIC
jgi:hypothetical protein